MMPTLPAELVAAERVQPLAGRGTGELVTIDRGVLGEVYERLAETIGAIERGNQRSAGVKELWRCTSAILSTGIAPAGCGRPE